MKQRYGLDSKVSILGHMQRGGAPSVRDRVLAARLGAAAVDALLEGMSNVMIGEMNNSLSYIKLEETWTTKKIVPPIFIRLSNTTRMTLTFLQLVQVYQLEGMVALGKMLNPATNELSKSLQHAQYIIAVLEILTEKTKGNLSTEEQHFLHQTLTTLRLNYVDESENPSSAPQAELA